MTRIHLLAALILVSAGAAQAQNDTARTILQRFDSLRPGADDLGMYRLDWAASLDEAQQRASREKRPILLVIIHAQYGNLSSGHC